MTATRRQRAITAAVTLTVGVLIVGVMAVVGYRNLTAPVESSESSPEEAGCPAGQQEVSKKFIVRGEVQVSVYNAGGVRGAAGRTMDALEKAGFRPGEVANAPDDLKVRAAAVYSTEENDPEARLVAQFLGRKVPVHLTDEKFGPGVDVFVGNAQGPFNRKAARRIKLQEPVTSCAEVPKKKPGKKSGKK